MKLLAIATMTLTLCAAFVAATIYWPQTMWNYATTAALVTGVLIAAVTWARERLAAPARASQAAADFPFAPRSPDLGIRPPVGTR